MELIDRPSARFSVVLPNELRDRIRHQARALGTHESVVVKLVLRRYLVDFPAECPELGGYEPPIHRKPD